MIRQTWGWQKQWKTVIQSMLSHASGRQDVDEGEGGRDGRFVTAEKIFYHWESWESWEESESDVFHLQEEDEEEANENDDEDHEREEWLYAVAKEDGAITISSDRSSSSC